MNLIDKIALDLRMDTSYLSRIAERSNFYYRDYKIRKRNGDDRRISQPSPELKTLQYWVVYNIMTYLPVSSAAFAYKKGDSIKKHAELHKNAKHILHTDISEFFNSIHFEHLYVFLRDNKTIFDNKGVDFFDALQDIKNICFRNNSLCIGAVSSPIISNVIMYLFDTAVMDYCKTNNYTYSRYADDIYISSNHYIEQDIISFLQEELKKLGLSMNMSKTRFFSSKYCRKITGIVITNDSQVSIGTERRNNIKKMIYDKLIHNKGDSEQILGYLSFVKDIEPHTYNNLIIKYSKYCDGDIIAAIRKK